MNESKPRVLLIGAGIAGLACARELITRGHDVKILEARTRVGGRLNTIHLHASIPSTHLPFKPPITNRKTRRRIRRKQQQTERERFEKSIGLRRGFLNGRPDSSPPSPPPPTQKKRKLPSSSPLKIAFGSLKDPTEYPSHLSFQSTFNPCPYTAFTYSSYNYSAINDSLVELVRGGEGQKGAAPKTKPNPKLEPKTKAKIKFPTQPTQPKMLKTAVDMGGMFVHGTLNNPLTDLAKSVGINTNVMETTILLDMNGMSIPSEIDEKVENNWNKILELAEAEGRDRSVTSPLELEEPDLLPFLQDHPTKNESFGHIMKRVGEPFTNDYTQVSERASKRTS